MLRSQKQLLLVLSIISLLLFMLPLTSQATPCTQDSDCASLAPPHLCQFAARQCMQTAYFHSGGACLSNSDCGRGGICNTSLRVCQGGEGTAETINCNDRRCSAGQAWVSPRNACMSFSDIMAPRGPGHNGFMPIGCPCNNNSQCVSSSSPNLQCQSERCVLTAASEGCGTDADCASGFRCQIREEGHRATRTFVSQCVPTSELPPAQIALTRLQIPLVTLQPFTVPFRTTEGDREFLIIDFLAQYLAAVYKFLVSVVGVIAGIMIVYAGFKWLTAGGSPDKISDAKRKIADASVGLILVLGSYIILMIINPDLVVFQPLRVEQIEKIELEPPGAGEEIRETGTWTTGATNYNITDQCLPIKTGSLQQISWNWGDDRAQGARCHAGIDLYTQGDGEVVALDSGEVVNTYNFYPCSGGQSVAVLVFHPKLNITVVYGEINSGTVPSSIRARATVTKGQTLGKATFCDMLHLEAYPGRARRNFRWNPPPGQSTIGTNKCAREFLITKPPSLLDPTNLIKGLESRPCP